MKKLCLCLICILVGGVFLTNCKQDDAMPKNTYILVHGGWHGAWAWKKVVPLLQQYCYSCHTGSFPSGNQLMGTYTADKAMALNGKLYGTIAHAAGYSPMPQGMAKLSNCQIAVIKKWIDSGTLNN